MDKKIFYAAFAAMALSSFAFAVGSGGLSGVTDAVVQMCADLKAMLPVVSMLMVIAAGVIYAAGQLMGAETRARATTWATAMLLGAVIGILIVVVAPTVLQKMYPSISTSNSCW